ncbi:LTA synthase family protein [Desulfobulbus alkaliphilus]|uniref:LTA synthase family protein n=1 Tax=Desulfobulbus alkaliphilus TaxID=869814 RepID=UPI0019640A18|nr:LTA synthase family protein [Desulfobulbus alkaliphilus]MBM9535786.1 LTA synthase family protein [Desulfobulbus alkaliphilus]
MKNSIALILLALASFMPACLRLASQGLSQPVGLLSDSGLGLLVFLVTLYSPHWLRLLLVLFWALFQTSALELVATMQRLPTWQDLQYLADPAFVHKSTAGFNLAAPGAVSALLLTAVLVCFLPVSRPARRWLGPGLAALLLIMVTQGFFSTRLYEHSIVARYNPLHWFIVDAVSSPLPRNLPATGVHLPPGLSSLDLNSSTLLPRGKAENLLIVIVEGIPGLYYPAIRTKMGVDSHDITMDRLAAATEEAMLIPDFTVHSHQTIRGLYAILCGDYSKLSWTTPKAYELQQNPERADQCLPAQLAQNGWSTHYLQAAGLGFMSKDRAMPLMGFQTTLGSEWFTEPNPFPFSWGPIDPVFFRGAATYIAELQSRNQPWMLTLLTVGTHQPYGVSDSFAAQYPSRQQAAIALLDEAVADFIAGLRRDGVLDNTLVLITSDESHGSALADWVSSWGLAIILAPDDDLPRIKQGGYGLVDITASLLDYFGLNMPPDIIGRSFFREYPTPGEMIAFTASKLRRHTADNLRYECTTDGRCLVGTAPSLLGFPPADFAPDKDGSGSNIFTYAVTLDRSLHPRHGGSQVLHFAEGELRRLPEKIISEWGDNLIGAQYLDFPAHSRVHVSIRVRAVEAHESGIRMQLLLKQWERNQNDIPIPSFPVLRAGEESTIEFSFENTEARQSFSFHLLGEGKNATIQMEDFVVTVETMDG